MSIVDRFRVIEAGIRINPGMETYGSGIKEFLSNTLSIVVRRRSALRSGVVEEAVGGGWQPPTFIRIVHLFRTFYRGLRSVVATVVVTQ